MAGFGDLANVLLGGVDREGAYQEGRFRSAQTEGALANARKSQADALAQEKESALWDELAANPAAIANADPRTLGLLALTKLGAQYSGVQEGRLRQQKFGNLEAVTDPTSSALQRQRALQAVEGQPSSDIVKVGKGYVNLTEDKPQVQFLGDEVAADLSTAAKNFTFEQQLRKAQGLPPLTGQQALDSFREQARAERVVTAGGVPTKVGSGQAVVAPEQVAANVAATAGAKTTAVGQAKRQLDLPAAKTRLASTTKKVADTANLARQIQADDSLWQGVGLTQIVSKIPGTKGANIAARLNTLRAKLGFAVLQEMRDNSKTGGSLGNVSNFEVKTLQDAIASLDVNQSVGDIREQLDTIGRYFDDLGVRLTDAFYETYPELRQGQAPAAGGNQPTRTPAAPAPAPGSPIRVNSPEEARKLPKGTTFVTPDGRTMVVR